MTPAPTSPSPAARLSLRSERLNDDGRGAQLDVAAAHLLFVQGAPFQGGGREPQPEAENAKGVILARAILTIAREDGPGPVVRAILPQGPHAPAREASRL